MVMLTVARNNNGGLGDVLDVISAIKDAVKVLMLLIVLKTMNVH